MGFWDRELNGPLDEMFDLDRDGIIDPAEETFKYDFLNGFLDKNDDYDVFDDDSDWRKRQ